MKFYLSHWQWSPITRWNPEILRIHQIKNFILHQLFVRIQNTTLNMTSTIIPTQVGNNSQSGPKEDSISPETALRLPDTCELLTHLRLVDAIICLRNAVEEYGEMSGMKRYKAWDQFCQAAAAKFLEWSENVDVSKASVPTPTLDILMIWHSYMLNTKDYIQFQNEAFRGRMAGKGIDWQDLVRCFPSYAFPS